MANVIGARVAQARKPSVFSNVTHTPRAMQMNQTALLCPYSTAHHAIIAIIASSIATYAGPAPRIMGTSETTGPTSRNEKTAHASHMRHPHAASRSFRIASNLAFFAAKASIDVILAKLARGSREAEYDATPAPERLRRVT
jgi:hypothetical protein